MPEPRRTGICAAKHWYRTEMAARAAIPGAERDLQAAGRLRGPLHAYRCPSCPGWHLTSRRDPEFHAHDLNGRRDAPLGERDMVNARALLRSIWSSRTNP